MSRPLAAPRGWAAAAAAAALALLLALSVLPMGAGEGKFHLLEAAAAAAALPLLAVAGPGALASPVSRALGLLLAWAAASTRWAPDRQAAVDALLWSATLALVLLLAARFGRSGVTATLVVLLLVALPVLVHALLQGAGLLPHPDWAHPTRLAGTFVNSNLFGAFAASVLVAALGLLVAGEPGRMLRALAVAAAPLAAASLALTASRGAWLAFVGGSAVLLAAALGAGRRRLLALAAAALVVLASGTALAARGGGLERVRQRLASAGAYSLGHRLAIYRGALELLRVRPLGVGLGGLEPAFPRFRQHSDRFRVNFVHCEPLELGCALGLPGLALAGLALQRARSAGALTGLDPEAVTAVAVLAVLALQSLYDFPLHKPTLGLLAAALAGGLLGGRTPRPGPGRAPAIVLTSVLLVTALAFARGEWWRARAESQGEAGAFSAAETSFHRADRWLAAGSASLAHAAGTMNARAARAPGIGGVLLARARAWYRRALARDPGDGATRAEAALLAGVAGDAAERALLAAAAELAPQDGATVAAAAERRARDGDLAAALRLAGRGLVLVPLGVAPAAYARQAAALPAEAVALAPPLLPEPGRVVAALAAERLTLAARLLAARHAPRWKEAPRWSAP